MNILRSERTRKFVGEYMKYVVILGDGMADYPSKALNGRTPLEVAVKPNIDELSKRGKIGLVKTIPDGMKPGSDVANLSMMGYAPDKYYTGRSPLEALSIGVDLKDDDVAIRCNLVTLSDEEVYADKTMIDYSAGEISTKEAKELIEYLQQNLGDEYVDFHAGVSYRHCLVAHKAQLGTDFTPPHDITDKKIAKYLPKGEYGDIFLDIMVDSYNLLKEHPINKKRIENGLKPANSIWLWGEGTRPNLASFEEKYGIKGAVISAVDLIKGIGKGAKMKVVEVEGATGTYKTNFKGKAEAAIKALKKGCDYVYIHMEAPDECGHQGDADNKVKSIELIDSMVVKYVKEQLDLMGEDYKILIAPDHPTPLKLKTHTSDPVPFIIYSRKAGGSENAAKGVAYSEDLAQQSGLVYSTGEELMQDFLYSEIVIDSPPEEEAIAPVAAQNEDKKKTKAESEEKKDDKKEEKSDDKKEEKPKQKKKLDKKIVLIIAACVCLAGILLSIILPVVFYHQPRIFVKSANGFVAKKVGSINKYFYVLDKGITCENLTLNDDNIYSIDLNKHTLKVTEKFTVETSKEGTLYIGTRKGKKFVTNKKSNLKAGTIEINAPDLDVVLMANVSCENLIVNAKSLTLYNINNGAAAEIKAEITAQKVTFVGEVSGTTLSDIKIVNCPETIVEKGVKFEKIKLSLENSALTESADSAIASLTLDDNSTAIINGAITTSLEGGKQVIMKDGHSCPAYRNVKTLILFRKDGSNHNLINCEKIIYVEKLEKPVDILIEKRDNKIFCKVARGKYATKYKFVISDGNAENDVIEHIELKSSTSTPELDITDHVTTPGKSYTITVTPEGNYKDDLDFENCDESTLYTDGESVSEKYNYVITLTMPTGLFIYTRTEGDVKSTIFEFDKVAYADSYKILIDGAVIDTSKMDTEGYTCTLDITQYVNKVGDHSIRVCATHTKNPNIEDSPYTMISHSTTEKLKAVAVVPSGNAADKNEKVLSATITENIGQNNETIAIVHASWQGVQNGQEYLVKLKIDNTEIEIGRTSILTDGSVGFSFELTDLDIAYDSQLAKSGKYQIVVAALGYGYYETSDDASCVANLIQSIGSGNNLTNNGAFYYGDNSSFKTAA